MTCYRPLEAYVGIDGGIVFAGSKKETESSLRLPCGRCVGCRMDRARDWTLRMMHEASLQENNCFVTLTYSEENVPPGGSLRYSDFQQFIRKLRRREHKVRFFMCGEYGDENNRPHYHACLFGVDFSFDRFRYQCTRGARPVWRSPFLESLWPHGYSSFGLLESGSAAYVARYVLKKVTGPDAEAHYRQVDPVTGEVTYRVPEFARMSLKPGIGAEWFSRFHPFLVDHDKCVMRGSVFKVPRFYDKLMKAKFPVEHARISEERMGRALERSADATFERLAVREQVEESRLGFYKRKL